MARTKQTARLSVGGNAATKKRKRGSSSFESESINYDVTYESAFYAHYFENYAIKKTNESNNNKIEEENKNQVVEVTKEAFEPKWVIGECVNPFSSNQEKEYWLGLNFHSKFDGNGIKTYGRPKLQLIFTLDISGSMGMTFEGEEDPTETKATKPLQKIEVAKQAIHIICSQLQPEDSFGLVVFDDKAEVIQTLTKWKDTAREELEKKINSLKARNGTCLELGLKTASDLYANAEEELGTSRRIFFLTDMQANATKFLEMTRKNSDESLFTTVVGIGVDLTQSAINELSATPGCNYANVRSTKNFQELMEREFGYLVTPVAFNIGIMLESQVFQIEKGYGSPELYKLCASKDFKLSTEFPSAQNEMGERRGGLLLFKLSLKDSQSENVIAPFLVKVKHDDLQGIERVHQQTLQFQASSQFQTFGIRKAILLVRFTDFIKDFLLKREQQCDSSFQLKTSLEAFIQYFESEKKVIGDETLKEELDVMNKILQLFKDVKEEKEQDGKQEEESVQEGSKKISAMTVVELKEELKRNNKSVSGSKQELIKRLKATKKKL